VNELLYSPKIKPEHLTRKAIVYLRQSSERQVRQNIESQRLQYELAERIRGLGWQEIETINSDLGCSAAMASAAREGFERVLSSVALGEVGIVVSREVSRLSRTDKDWCRLFEVCQIFGTLIGDEQQVYDLSYLDDQLVLGIKGTLSVVELKVLRQRLQAGQESKARRGELFKRLPVGYARDGTGKIVLHPDSRVGEAIRLVFTKFRDCGACAKHSSGFVITMWSYPRIQSGERGSSGRFPRRAWLRTFCAILFMPGPTFGEGAQQRHC
jgi:DNA invertase Pin-like site-specific DNA recombinase